VKLFSALGVLLVATAAACASAQQSGSDHADAPVLRPLGAFATRPIVVLPTNYFRAGDSLGWAGQAGDPREYLATLDAEISFALTERRLDRVWILPEKLEASVRRNPSFATDPHDLSAEWLRPPGPRKMPEQLPEPLASQLRTLVALHEGAQYVLFPVEVRFQPAGGGAGQALLRIALLDTRRSHIVFMGDVRSDPSPAFSPAVAASLAGHLADLIAAP
jgi:hypothetical protein